MNPSFDLNRFQDRIAASAQRLKLARSFRQPDQVPVEMAVGGSFCCALLGQSISDYYQDIALQIDVQRRGQEWALETLGDDRFGIGLYVDMGPIQEALLFGADIVRPEGTSPWALHIIHEPADVEKLPVPDPAESPGVQWYYRELERMRALAQQRGVPYPVSGGFGIHPPLSAACALAGPGLIYEWMYEEPALVRQLFDKLLQAFFRMADYTDERRGSRRTSIGIADDHSAFVSADMYRKQVMPYNLAIYERYGARGRSLHADGPNDHLFRLYADEMHLTEMDIGGFSDIANAKRDMAGKTVIFGGLNCKDLYRDFETARPVVERAVSIGAPGGGFIFAVGGEAYAGVNPDTLVQAVAHAQAFSRKL